MEQIEEQKIRKKIKVVRIFIAFLLILITFFSFLLRLMEIINYLQMMFISIFGMLFLMELSDFLLGTKKKKIEQAIKEQDYQKQREEEQKQRMIEYRENEDQCTMIKEAKDRMMHRNGLCPICNRMDLFVYEFYIRKQHEDYESPLEFMVIAENNVEAWKALVKHYPENARELWYLRDIVDLSNYEKEIQSGA